MKKFIIAAFLSVVSYGQDLNYNIESFINQDLNINKKAPNTHYIGNAWLKRLIVADEDFEYNLTQATFQSDSTLDWHKHSTGQVLIIVDGEGYYQEKGKEVIVLKKGDVIKCDKNVEHWHSSTLLFMEIVKLFGQKSSQKETMIELNLLIKLPKSSAYPLH
jgi:quercetin dioxygenase-like cupin family protein